MGFAVLKTFNSGNVPCAAALWLMPRKQASVAILETRNIRLISFKPPTTILRQPC